MDNKQLARDIYRVSHLTGEFLLRSGQTSTEYFDKYMFTSDPGILARIAEELAKLIPPGTEVLAGLEMGAIPLAAALSMRTGLPAAYVRKKAKEYGTRLLAEGAAVSGKKTLVIEDIVTTGGQIIESTEALRAIGADVGHVLCVVQRNDKATDILAEAGLKLTPLFTMEYIKAVAEA